MTRGNGKSQPDSLDVEHELPAEGSEEATPSAAADVDQLQAELEKARSERDSYFDRLARLQAEFDNFRKRTAREQQEFREYAVAEAVKSMLPVLDSFDRALAAPEGGDFRAGLALINRQFHDALAKLGVEPLQVVGEPFDPQVHQAVQMVDTTEADDNHVLDELQRGYKLKDRLLRPAMVRVARNPGK